MVNFISNIRSAIGIRSVGRNSAKQNSSSNKNVEAKKEDSLYEFSFEPTEKSGGTSILKQFEMLVKEFTRIMKSFMGGVKDAPKLQSSVEFSTSGLADDVQGIISELDTDKLPKNVSKTVSRVTKAFESGETVQKEDFEGGVKEYIETPNGRYEIKKLDTGEIKMAYQEFDKDGTAKGGQEITLHPGDKTVETYSLFIDDNGEEHKIGSYFYSYDGELVKAFN